MPPPGEFARTLRFQRERLRRWVLSRPPLVDHDDEIREAVAHAPDAVAMTQALVAYFLRAQRHYRDRHGTLAYYPGWPSIYGARNDAVEGVTRLLPLWAAYAGSPCARADDAAAAADVLRSALANGCDPGHPGYWGDITDRKTLICEAADVALAVWLARDHAWRGLTDTQRAHVLRWLGQVVGKRTADNNWHLFVVLVDAVLAELDPAHHFSSEGRLDRIRQFATTDGCFRDGPDGAVDFYNAWGFHYALFWLGEMRTGANLGGMEQTLAEFCEWYQWLFTEQGLPLFGRSLCYRFAACVPLLACALRQPQVIPPGVALSAFLANWRFFVAEGGLRAGRPTQGVFGDDIRWLDPYSGPASSFWGTRSLVMFLYAQRQLPWSAVLPLPLPSTVRPVDIEVAALGARLSVAPCGAESVVQFFRRAPPGADAGPRRHPARDTLRELVYARASRQAESLLRAGEDRFSSKLVAYRAATPRSGAAHPGDA